MLVESELVKRILLAAVIGGLIGAEREMRGRSAGFRTNILIAVGCAIFTIVSMTVSPSSPDRIASNIVTGVGFLGAGAIMRGRATIHGLTTAATVWVNAALGTAAGAGLYRRAITGGATTLAVLVILSPIERLVERDAGRKRD